MILDLIFFSGVGAGALCIGVLIFWMTEDFGGRDD